MKRTPDLHFVYDETTETAARIEELLSEEVKKAQERDQASSGDDERE
jgi:ribosome-binding factor A